jgi:CelD/BcsL family acetyltransferase involved in cellulose biosynthesis
MIISIRHVEWRILDLIRKRELIIRRNAEITGKRTERKRRAAIVGESVHALPYGLERKTGTATFAVAPVGDVAALERQWRALDRSGAHSFFATWTWASALLQNAPGMQVLKATRAGALAGLALCQRRRRQIWFNASGARTLDGVMIEHNSFALPDREDPALWRDLTSWFASGGLAADELLVPGTAAGRDDPADLIVLDDGRDAYRAPLTGLGGEGVASLLSRNARQQLRRSLRDFGGELRIAVASDAATALDYFAQMKRLHIRSWTRRGRPNAFDNPAFEPFHRAVIAAGVGEGSVDLMEITGSGRVLGYLYNFKRNGVVHSYQSGFADDDPALRPGYVCHALAIGHYARAGLKVYDFLAGTNRLKQSFGIETYRMCWRRYRRPTLGFRLERWLRQVVASRRKALKEG